MSPRLLRPLPLLLSGLLFAVACSHPLASNSEFTINATVQLIPVEGGCWAIKPNDQTTFEPMNLRSAFQRDGLQVTATLRRRDDMGSICMIGPIVEVLDIRTR